MTDNNVPPHMTISAIEARSENALLGAMYNLRNSLSNGTISIVSVGQLLPYVFYATPVLNGYLQDLSEKVFDEVKSIPECAVSRLLQANELAATYYTWKDTDKGTDADGIFSNAGKLCAF